MNNNGKMEFIKDTKATKEKIEFDIFCLENAINEDKKNNDKKSLEFHSLALEGLKQQLNDLEMENK